jgi:transposase
MSMQSVAQKLGIHKSTVSRTLQKLQKNPNIYAPILHSGPPKLITTHHKQGLHQEIISGKSPNGTAAHFNLGLPGTPATTCNALIEMGLPGCHRHEKAAFTKKYAMKWLHWA